MQYINLEQSSRRVCTVINDDCRGNLIWLLYISWVRFIFHTLAEHLKQGQITGTVYKNHKFKACLRQILYLIEDSQEIQSEPCLYRSKNEPRRMNHFSFVRQQSSLSIWCTGHINTVAVVNVAWFSSDTRKMRGRVAVVFLTYAFWWRRWFLRLLTGQERGREKKISQTDLKVDSDTVLYGMKYRKSIPQAILPILPMKTNKQTSMSSEIDISLHFHRDSEVQDISDTFINSAVLSFELSL